MLIFSLFSTAIPTLAQENSNDSTWNVTLGGGLPMNLNAVWGSSAEDVFAVGDDSTIFHYNGSGWSRSYHQGPRTHFRAVCDRRIVGDSGTIIGYSSRQWNSTTSPTTEKLTGISGKFAVGDKGTILHFNSTWSPITSGVTENLNAVWGDSATDVFAVGDAGTILHYNGDNWTLMTSGVTENLNAIWGYSNAPVFAVGDGGTIILYNGKQWSSMTSGTAYNLKGVWGISASEFFAVGEHGTILHYSPYEWSFMSTSSYDLLAVWNSSPSDVFAVGENRMLQYYDNSYHYYSRILHYDGSTWAYITIGNGVLYGSREPLADLNDVWGSSSSDVFVAGDNGMIFHYNGDNWTLMNSNCSRNLKGIWGSSVSDIYAVGDRGAIMHYDGNQWSTTKRAGNIGATTNFEGIWGSSGSDVFVVGEAGTIVHYDGNQWSLMPSGTSTKHLKSIWGSSATDVFAVAVDGSRLHYNGSRWSFMQRSSNSLSDIWGISSNDVFAVGDDGVIEHYDGNQWNSITISTIRHLKGIWGSSATDVFVVGEDGIVLHYPKPVEKEVPPPVKKKWTPPPAPTPARFTVSDLSITPEEVELTEQVTVSVRVVNSGGRQGSYSVVLKVNDAEESQNEVTLGSGENQMISFEIAKEVAGIYSVDINGEVGQFTVIVPQGPEPEVVSAPVAPEQTQEPTPLQESGGMSCGQNSNAQTSGLGDLILLIGALTLGFLLTRFK